MNIDFSMGDTMVLSSTSPFAKGRPTPNELNSFSVKVNLPLICFPFLIVGNTVYTSTKSSTYKKNGTKVTVDLYGYGQYNATSLSFPVHGFVSTDSVTVGGKTVQNQGFVEMLATPTNSSPVASETLDNVHGDGVWVLWQKVEQLHCT